MTYQKDIELKRSEMSCDIAGRDRLAHALRVSEVRYRRLFETAKDGILILDAESGIILDANPFLIELLNSSLELFIGKKVWELGFFKDIFANHDKFLELQQKGYVRYENLPLETDDGRKIDVEFVSNVYFEGDVCVIQCNIRDISERKKGEVEKAKLELQLRESQKMDAIGQLAAGIAHDFNNILSVVTGYSHMLLENTAVKASERAQIEEIFRAGEHASSLTSQLLVFSRHKPVETKIIDLDTIVSDMEKMLSRLIRKDTIVTRNIGLALWRIKADSGNIEQVIMNLFINASDAMPNGGELTVKTENVEIDRSNSLSYHSDIEPGSYVMLSVSDTGCGMDDKVREHIFEPFFTTKEVGKGTGLGLATVYGIVKQSNAYIDVKSELGKGTMFRIYFPKVVDECFADKEKQKTASIHRGDETILLAEDEDGIRVMLQAFLQSIGYKVLPASNAKEAFELAKNHKEQIHLLLADVVMPRMNGYELAEQLRDSLPEIKLLFMSGYINPTNTIETVKTNGDLIKKPIHLDALALKIREILD